MTVPEAPMSPEATPSAIARCSASWRRLLPNLHSEPDLRSTTAIQSRHPMMIECAPRTLLMRRDRLYRQIRISSSQSSG
jgi:hypothetical protein